MKKIFTLLAAVLMTAGAYAQESVTAKWALGDGVFDGIPAVSSSIAITGTQTKGSSISDGNKRTAKPSSGDIPMTSWKHLGAKNAETGYIEFIVTPATGYKFKATKIDFDYAGFGFGNARTDIEYINGDNKSTVASAVIGERSKETTADDGKITSNFHISKSITGISSDEPTIIRLYLYSKNSSDAAVTREHGFGNVIITGVAEATGETREPANISWAEDEISYKIRDKVENLLPKFSNPNNLDVTYTSSNTDVAEIVNGDIVLKNTKIGKAVITATFAGNDDYRPAAATLTVNVLTNKVIEYVTEAPEEKTFELDRLFSANLDEYDPKKNPIFSDANISISVRSETINGKVTGEYAGQKFSKSIQVRVESEPNEEDPWGDEYTDDNKAGAATTSLVIEPKVNMTLYVYGRRQVVEDESRYEEIDDTENNVITCKHYYVFEANDDKSLKFSDIDDPTPDADPTTGKNVYLNKNAYLGKWDGHDYAFGISEIDLEAGKSYNVYATGTTYHVQGIGYIINTDDPNFVRRTDHVIEYTTNATSQTDAAGYTLSRTGGNELSGGAKIGVDGTEYTSVTFKGIIDGEQQITYTVDAPDGKVVTKATVYAYTNDTEPAYFTKVGNMTFADGTTTSISSTDNKKPTVLTFDHIMLNSFDMEIHTTLNKNAYVVIELEVIDEEHNPALPEVKINDVTYAHGQKFDHGDKNLSVENVTIKVTATEGHEIYYKHEPAVVSTPEQQMFAARAIADEDIHAGYTKVENGEITVKSAGTLTIYAYDPDKNLKSAPTSVVFADATTGIDVIAAEAAEAEVEYYNLQGIRVANPENGIFIRKQGSTVTKVVIR